MEVQHRKIFCHTCATETMHTIVRGIPGRARCECDECGHVTMLHALKTRPE